VSRRTRRAEVAEPVLRDDEVIACAAVSKKFTRSLRRSLGHGALDLGRSFLGRPTPTERLRKGEFWAVDEVDLRLHRGEQLGILGRNGSGKTTLLRMMAGIFPPDRGEILVRGRVTALLAVGTGFHPHLTGRENVFLNGALLGLSRNEIERKYDEIVEFAELAEAIDMPIGMYSSGMRGRLGFAVSTALDPEVILLDEVMAVGDAAFRQKCFARLDELAGRSAMILVTHMPTHLRRLTTRCVWLEDGTVRADGPTDDVLDEYWKTMPAGAREDEGFDLGAAARRAPAVLDER
jgi:lipopolysaccharide transport system ATP-binding protein